ncbi:HesA/MoeB/ThiF family protein [Tropicimonas sp. IMCC34043]|uniref:HesA/MoeB/ThiF family protein n=1 Tax=Tropicimonas sp. IMCC34043 TaxID=2248760 RepID=UPI000E22D927|nr:HesA/MoeB/ThiF family protein [Tropicimonas sp. IMCC34043]
MLLVFFLCGMIWLAGWLVGAPPRLRGYMVAVLFLAVLAEQLLLPDGHPLREATGRSPMLWLMLGAFAALAAIYGRGLAWLRARARPLDEPASVTAATAASPAGRFSEAELDRYSRHIMLREIGGPGQKRLRAARVLVLGAGGLGSPALLYLAAAGVGRIGVIDDDAVENANLQRQVIHRDEDIGLPKVFSAAAAMRALNPHIEIRPYHRRFEAEIAADLLEDYDLILDGTDNFETRYLANRVAVAAGKPLISGALAQWEGQISVFDPARGTPCYQCVFPQAPAEGLAPSCAAAGVMGPLPGVIGSMMAVEAVKLIAGAGAPLRGRMLIFDALYGETRVIGLHRRADCPVCGAEARGQGEQ